MDNTVDGKCKAVEPGGLEPLLILEEGDDIDSIMCNIKKDKCEEMTSVVPAEESNGGSGIKENTQSTEEEQQVDEEASMCQSEDRTVKQTDMHKEQEEEEEEESGGERGERIQEEREMKATEAGTDVKREEDAMAAAGENVADAVAETVAEGEEEAAASHAAPHPAEEHGTDEAKQTEVASTEVVLRPKTQPLADTSTKSKNFLSPDDAQKKVNRLSSDFPDTLYEFLQKVQEGRRLNDQRCSFRLEQRRRCYSEPSTPRHSTSKAVMFSSMTSLQREEFFELVATSQARRLDDQRAEAESIQPLPPKPPVAAPASPPQQPKPSSDRKLSIKASLKKTPAAPAPRPKEELYNMILTSQAQGRLEEQRSRAPGPMDDEDFFSLLLKVQGGRMDEQRTELPLASKD